MGTRVWCVCLVLATLGVACGDQPTEVVVDQESAAGAGMSKAPGATAHATTTSDDGLVISTDKDDYQPGDTVFFSGAGWPANDTLDIVLTDEPLTHDPHRWSVNVGGDGTFEDKTYVVDEGDINVQFTLVATSRATGRSLTVSFTDNVLSTSVTLNGTSSVTVSPNATISLAVTGRITAQNPAPTNWRSTGWVLLAAPATAQPAAQLANCVNTDDVAGTTGNGTTATRTFSITAPSVPGPYDLWVAFSDVDGNGSTACGGGGTTAKIRFAAVVTVADQTPPGVTIDQATGQGDPTNTSPINFTVEFSKPVTGFTSSDVSLAGSTVGGTLSATVTGGPSSYNVAVTGMTGTGTVVATIPAGAAVGGAGNASAASTSTDNTVTFDATALGVAINQASGQADPTNVSPINYTVVFTKAVSGFTASDVSIGGTATTSTPVVTGSGATYNVAVPVTTDGTVIATIEAGVATDVAGNQNVASSSTDNEVTFDKTKPTVAVNQAAGQGDPTNDSPINFTVQFSEPVTGFAAGDVAISGTATTSTPTVTGTGATYNVAVPVTTDGTVIADIAAAVAIDLAGNANVASTSTDNTVTYDKTPPTVTINQAAGQADPTSASPINFTVVFSESVTGFAGADVALSGTASTSTPTVTGSGTTYNVAVPVTSRGTVTASIAAGEASDAAGNGNAPSTSTDHTVTYDPEPPVVSNVAVDPDPTNGTIDVTATAKVDDAATGNSKIVSAYYRIDDGPEIAMSASDGGFDEATENVTASIPAATVAGLAEGPHTVCVRGTDEAGNSSSFEDGGACVTLTVDKQPPVVSNVTVNPSLTNGTIAVQATARVDDAAAGNSRIVAAYYSIDGGSAVQMTASDGSFSSATENVKATIPASVVNALDEGTHTVCVQGKDLAGNLSPFSASGACATLEIDKTPPEVTINQKTGQADPTNASPINFTVSFTETVSDFATGDVTLSGTAGATNATVTGSGTTYNVAVSGMTGDGTVIASLGSGVAHDAAGNGNNGSTSTDHTVVYDNTPPVISCGAADGAWHAANVSIACTASDATSGLANAADASFSLSTNVAAGAETADAPTDAKSILDKAGNSATAGPVGGNKIDRKAPSVALTCPANPVILNDPAAVAHWTATDGGSGVAPDGTVSLVTTSIGSKTASATVQDNVGNSTTASCNYTVAYNFAGFSAPVDRPNTMNVSKAGQAIPLKWRLTDALGHPITDLTGVTVKAVAMNCDGSGAVDPIEEYATASTSGLLNLGNGNYQYNWKTATAFAGTCKSVSLVFGSGALSYIEGPHAFFSFKK
jgi:hypothetical protein